MTNFLCDRVLILRTIPEVFGKEIDQAIGAPQDYNKNKQSETFPDSYDLRIPGAERADNETMQVDATTTPQKVSAAAAAGHPEEIKQSPAADAVMDSARTTKQSKPAGFYVPIKALNQFTNDWTIKARVVKK